MWRIGSPLGAPVAPCDPRRPALLKVATRSTRYTSDRRERRSEAAGPAGRVVLVERIAEAYRRPAISQPHAFRPNEAAQESNLPTDGLHRPAGFEDIADLALERRLRVVSDHLSDHR
jgi:hypothetical protein